MFRSLVSVTTFRLHQIIITFVDKDKDASFPNFALQSSESELFLSDVDANCCPWKHNDHIEGSGEFSLSGGLLLSSGASLCRALRGWCCELDGFQEPRIFHVRHSGAEELPCAGSIEARLWVTGMLTT